MRFLTVRRLALPLALLLSAAPLQAAFDASVPETPEPPAPPALPLPALSLPGAGLTPEEPQALPALPALPGQAALPDAAAPAEPAAAAQPSQDSAQPPKALPALRRAVAKGTLGGLFEPSTLDAAAPEYPSLPVDAHERHDPHRSHSHGLQAFLREAEHGAAPPQGPRGPRRDPLAALRGAVGWSAGFVAAELAGGLLLRSVALKGDALHLAADWTLNAFALAALSYARRSGRSDFLRWAEPAFGLASAGAIGLTAAEISREALTRLAHPLAVSGQEMAVLALLGLAANAVSTVFLYRHRDAGLSLRGVFLHSLTDAAGSLAVVSSGALSWAFGWTWTDPAASALIVLLIGKTSVDLARQSWRALRRPR